MEAKYLPLPQEPSSSQLEGSTIASTPVRSREWRWKIATIFVSLLEITTLLWMYASKSQLKKLDSIEGLATVEQLPISWKKFHWNTEYSSRNQTESDLLWDAILPSHGFVAMDREWAASRGWHESMRLPSDSSKGVYLLEAYHQIHCVKIIRKTFWEAVHGLPYTHQPGPHIEHCFDALRQSVQCYADNTPLYTFGDKTAGNGQTHRCRDWNALRDWAAKHSACYRDTIHDVALNDHFGFCDDGHDGLIDDTSDSN